MKVRGGVGQGGGELNQKWEEKRKEGRGGREGRGRKGNAWEEGQRNGRGVMGGRPSYT